MGFESRSFFQHHRRVRAQLDLAMLDARACERRHQRLVGRVAVHQVIELERVSLGGERAARALSTQPPRSPATPRPCATSSSVMTRLKMRKSANRALNPLLAFLAGADRDRRRVPHALLQLGRDGRILRTIGSALDRHPDAVQVEGVTVFRSAAVVGEREVIPRAGFHGLVIRRLRANRLCRRRPATAAARHLRRFRRPIRWTGRRLRLSDRRRSSDSQSPARGLRRSALDAA